MRSVDEGLTRCARDFVRLMIRAAGFMTRQPSHKAKKMDKKRFISVLVPRRLPTLIP